MFPIEKFKTELMHRQSGKRLLHSLSVADEAVRLAKLYGADPDRAYAAGLLHDITKQESYENQLRLCADFDIILSNLERKTPKLLHAITGEQVARRELGVTDAVVLDAIRYHTTAKPQMPLLTAILYLADYVEPLRQFEGVELVREVVYTDFDEALRRALDATIIEVVEAGSLLHPDTLAARNEIVERRLTVGR